MSALLEAMKGKTDTEKGNGDAYNLKAIDLFGEFAWLNSLD